MKIRNLSKRMRENNNRTSAIFVWGNLYQVSILESNMATLTKEIRDCNINLAVP